VSWLDRLRRRGSGGPADPKPIYIALRGRLLETDPASLGLAPSPGGRRVWAVVMDTAFPEGVASLAVVADGTTSLYTSTGGGTIGAGTHENVAVVSGAFLDRVDGALDLLVPASSFPLPSTGRVRFCVLTFDGGRTTEADEQDLGEGRHPLSGVFLAGHDVLTELRKTDEQIAVPGFG
jgi:hypothetical protein